MKRDELDRAYGPTPQLFTDRIDDTLYSLKEDAPVNAKRFTLRTALIAALILLLLCGIAYAIVAMQGQEWYYNNRFTAYQEHEPDKHQAIMDNLQTEVPQEESLDTQGLVTVAVQDYAWVPEQNLFTLSLAARPTQDDEYELYSIYALDTDGANVGEIDPDDPESRMEHWLWTNKGFGLPQDVMDDPGKRLLLINFYTSEAVIDGSDVGINVMSTDEFIGEDGASIWVMELDPAALNEGATPRHARADGAQWDAESLQAYAERAKTAIADHTDADGYLTLRMDYWVYTFADGEIDYNEHTDGTVTFKVKVE